MDECLKKILDLFRLDQGHDMFNEDSIKFATDRWEHLHEDARKFLRNLTDVDLDNVCTGEVQTSPGGDLLHLYHGHWQKLPPAVDYFLTEVWEYVE